MKKLLTAFTLALCLQANAQHNPFYSFSKHTDTYSPLSVGTVVTSTFDQSVYQLNYTDGFKAYDVKLDRSFVVGRNGFALNTNMSADRSFAFDPFVASLKKHPVKPSELRSLLDINGGDTTIIIQWKDMGITGHPDTDYLNFQLHIHQNQLIEFRFGPGFVSRGDSIGDQKGANSQIFLLNSDFTTVIQNIVLNGPAVSPTPLTGASAEGYIGLPPNGTIYRFTPVQHTSLNEQARQGTRISLYPNPATDKLFIGEAEGSFSILDIAGKEVLSGRAQQQIDISALNPGVYYMAIEGAENNGMLKFIKQ